MLFAISNLSSSRVFRVEPWKFEPQIPTGAQAGKAAFIAWLAEPTAQHCVFSAMEGVDGFMRVGKSNPVALLHGFIADFDAAITREMREGLTAKCPTEHVPNWIGRTFSGGARAFWQLEAPLPFLGLPLLAEFLKTAAKRMKLNRLLPGFDKEAFEDGAKYYEVGSEWKRLHTEPIAKGFVYQWLLDAGNRLIWKPKDLAAIPMTDIASEVNRQYPGKWSGAFEVGARGVRFWDDTADNDTGALVRETGMQCFTGPVAFTPWSEILGRKFTEKYELDRTQAILEGAWFDGSDYWRLGPDGAWRSYGKEDYKLYLKVRHGLSIATGKNETSSEVDRMLFQIQEHKFVVAALPFVHFPPGLLWFQEQRHLNTCAIKAMAPAATEITVWGDRFPWLAHFLQNFFFPKDQLHFFLAWLRHYYVNALRQTPALGQAIFVAGDVGVGKTLLSNVIIASLAGGHADGSEFLLGEENFTSHVLSVPLITVDDTSPAADVTRHTRYTAMIKKIVANQHLQYEKKFQAAGHVKWLGRVVVTCNLDPESIRLLPNMELSVLDKISLFRCARFQKNFPESEALDVILSQELPYFCRWLINWTPPPECPRDLRFGVRSYHEATLYRSALQSGNSYAFLELLQAFLCDYSKHTKESCWEGTATGLLAMLLTEPYKEIARSYKALQVATWLGQLKARGFKIGQVRGRTGRIWRVPLQLEEPVEKQETVEHRQEEEESA